MRDNRGNSGMVFPALLSHSQPSRGWRLVPLRIQGRKYAAAWTVWHRRTVAAIVQSNSDDMLTPFSANW